MTRPAIREALIRQVLLSAEDGMTSLEVLTALKLPYQRLPSVSKLLRSMPDTYIDRWNSFAVWCAVKEGAVPEDCPRPEKPKKPRTTLFDGSTGLTKEQKSKIIRSCDAGISVTKIATQLGITRNTVYVHYRAELLRRNSERMKRENDSGTECAVADEPHKRRNLRDAGIDAD